MTTGYVIENIIKELRKNPAGILLYDTALGIVWEDKINRTGKQCREFLDDLCVLESDVEILAETREITVEKVGKSYLITQGGS